MSEKNIDASSGEPDEEDILEAKSSEEDVLKLKKEDFFKIVEDPYFQYLVEKKARAQTRAYLILVGSAILAILVYAGWEFKSAKELINKEKADILLNSQKIQQTADDAKTQHEQTSNTVASARKLFEDSQQFAQQSRNMTNGMLTAAQGNIENSQNAQKLFFDQQGNLLSTVLGINKEAQKQLNEVGTQLKSVDNLADNTKKSNQELIDSTKKSNQELIDNTKKSNQELIDNTIQRTTTVLQNADVIEKKNIELDHLTAKAKRLESIQQRVLEGGLINATVFMRSKKATTIKMLDPDNPEDKANDWVLTFTKFQLTDKKLNVFGNAKKGAAPSINFVVPDINAQPTDAVRDFIPLPNKIPFQIQLNFAYHTFFSVDFASLNIAGMPSERTIANNDSRQN